jgi:hypothetical protein
LQVFPVGHVPQDPPHPSVPQLLPVQLGTQEVTQTWLELQVFPGEHVQLTVPPHSLDKEPHFPTNELDKHVLGAQQELL